MTLKKPMAQKRAKQTKHTHNMKKTKTEPSVKPTEQDRLTLRLMVRAREDFQAQRKRMDNRVGRKADGTDQNIEERAFRPDDLQDFLGISTAAREQEEAIEKRLKQVLKRFPIWNDWLESVKGVGTITAATLIAELDIHKATTVSKMWQYAGLNPTMVAGKKRVKTDNPKTYQPKTGEVIKRMEDAVIVQTNEPIRGDKLTEGFLSPFNTRLRVALCGVMADSFIKSGLEWQVVTEEHWATLPERDRERREKKIDGKMVKDAPCGKVITSPYVKQYDDYKHRLEHSEQITSERGKGGAVKSLAWKDVTPMHRHRAAIRKMVKAFLADLYANWRAIEGLEVRVPYQEQYLGHKHAA